MDTLEPFSFHSPIEYDAMDCVKLSDLKENIMLTWLTVLPLMAVAVLFGRYLNDED